MREYVYYNCGHNELTVISEWELANYSPTYYYNQLHNENYYILYKSCKTLIYIGEL